MTAKWSAGHRLFAFLAALAFCAVIFLLLGSADLTTMVLVLLFCAVMLWLGASIAMPPELSRDRLRRYSLRVAWALTAAVLAVGGAWQGWLLEALQRLVPERYATLIPDLPETPLALVLGATWLGVVALNWIWRDRTATGQIRAAIDAEFPDRTFLDRLRLTCRDLRNDLDRTDADTAWSHAHFVPIEAEVEVVGDGQGRRHVADLLDAIRQDRTSRLFLVLGDPGAGKSVALRKLSRELLEEVEKSGRLPVYVNLKEWRPAEPWTRDRPPDVEQLKSFILGNLRRRVGMSAAFLNEYFDRMVDHGRIFLILDSFDEIPAVLDVEESSWLVQSLSEAVTDLLSGGSETRGVVASRYYRRPRLAVAGYRLMDIRAFSEQKIATAIEQATTQADRVKHAVFVGRPDLGAVVNNPFLLGLLLSYVERHGGALPGSIVDLYGSFIDQRLADAAEELREHGLDAASVRRNAEAIAREMFGADGFGLEMPMAMLGMRLPGRRIEITAELLASLRIGRISPGGRAFSFVHRRFNEYFLVNRFRAEPELVPLEAIPGDARQRDAIVLYVAIAEPAEAERIAAFCMQEAAPLMDGTAASGDVAYRRGLHALRFLVEAFRGRKTLLAPHAARFEAFIAERLEPQGDVLLAKNAVEAIGLTSTAAAPGLMAKALELPSDWLLQTAIRSARYLGGITEPTRDAVLRYFLQIPRWRLLGSQAATLRILSLSENLAPVARRLRLHALEFVHLMVWLTIGILLLPMPALLLIAFVLLELLVLTVIFFVTGDWAKAMHDRAMQRRKARKSGPLWHRLDAINRWFAFQQVFGPSLVIRLISVPTSTAAGLVSNALTYLIAVPVSLALILASLPFLNATNDLPASDDVLWLPLLNLLADHPRPKGIILLACGLLGLPWYSIYWFVRWCLRNGPAILAAILGVCLMLLAMAALLIGVGASGVFDSQTAQSLTPMLFLLFLLGGLATLMVTGFRKWLRHRRARRDARDWLARFDGQRATIAAAFAAIGTPQGRSLFLTGLETVIAAGQFRSALEGAENTWPAGSRPNLGDGASTRLAQLDEIWLGLDR